MIIMTDTPSLYSPAEGEKQGLAVIPACTVIDGQVYRDYADISTADFLEKLYTGLAPTASQPSIGEIVEVYEQSDDEILVIPIGDGLSGTYQNMVGAKKLVENSGRIHVIDTKTLAGPQRYLVDKAIELRNMGMNIERIKTILQESIESSCSVVIPRDFQFLKRSGRLTPFAARLGSAMRLIPVMTQTGDKKKITKFCIKNSPKSALNAILEHLKKLGVSEEHLITVSHGGDEAGAKSALELIQSRFEKTRTALYELPPALVCHGGPGCILIQAVKL